MVSKQIDERPTGNHSLPRNILSAHVWDTRGSDRYQHLGYAETPQSFLGVRKDDAGKLVYPVSGRDSAACGLGHGKVTTYVVSLKSVYVNVGGVHAEASSPPVKHARVGGVIVL